MGLSKKAAKAKEPGMKKSIIQWCKDLHEAGNDLTMKWEGGGDSGWIYFEIGRSCYGLPQAGILANDQLRSWLEAEGYYEATTTPGL
jgi:hypothetical protein